MSDPESLGITRTDALQLIEILAKRRKEILKKLESMAKHLPLGDAIPQEEILLQANLRDTDSEMDRVRDWYSLRVLEGLESSTNRLNTLTRVLIILTGGLIVFTLVLAWPQVSSFFDI